MRIKLITLFFFILASVSISANQSLPAVIYDESKVDSLCSVMQSRDMSHSKKIALISSFSSISLYTEYFHKLQPLFSNLLEESHRNSDNNGVLFCYNSLANLYLGLWDKENVKKNLDSAEVYVNQAKNMQFIASYYGSRGRYIQRFFPDKTPEAISDYQNSLYYFDKAGMKGVKDEIVIILRNLVVDGIQRNDSAYSSKNFLKIEELKKTYDSPILEFLYMDVKALLNEVYYMESSEEKYIDSMLISIKNCLSLYENNLLPKSFSHLAIDLYVSAASVMSLKKGTDNAIIDSLLLIAENNFNLTDSIGIARIYQVRASAFLDRNMIDSAEALALKSQKYLEVKYNNNYYSRVKSNIDILRQIYYLKGDYKKAIEYDDLWTKTDEEMRANETKELELQFEADAKGLELRHLNSDIMYQDNIHKLYILTCILLCLATLFLILLIRSKRKSLNNRLALIGAEREDAKLKLKLKEEQTVKAQLEKYEVLSDFHLKEMELIGKNKDIEQLYEDKGILDKQVESFRQKVEAYELSERGEQTNSDIQHVILEDLRRLISKQIPEKSIYINNINFLRESYIDSLCEKSDEKLSISYLKYCICFAVGMGISEVAECFEIEQSSVHMIRYRLKKKFELGNDDDLSVFLQKNI